MAERRAAVPAFLRKVYKWRPKIVCMVGKGIWEDVFAYVVKASKGKCIDDGVRIEQSSSGSRPKGLAEHKANFQFDIQPICVLHGSESESRCTDLGERYIHGILRETLATNAGKTLFFVVPSTSGRVLTHQVI